MKTFAKALLLPLVLLAATLASATQHFDHIIIVVQENRSVDNLFGYQSSTAPLPPGVNVSHVGNYQGQQIGLTAVSLKGDFDPDHSHGSFNGICGYDTNAKVCKMDGEPTQVICGGSDCCANYSSICRGDYLWIKYVDNSSQQIQPYFDIANKYGFANYFFQTNEGPSFPAHQFLFGGTSAPSASSNLFAAENPAPNGHGYGLDTGCTGKSGQTVALIDYQGREDTHTPTFPCYDHPTLSDLLEPANVGWGYYAEDPYYLWTAPNAIVHICFPIGINGNQANCDGADFLNHVFTSTTAQILTDLGANTQHPACNLPQESVTWVIPDGAWSDHPNPEGQYLNDAGFGPSWVASIINAVGGTDNSGNPLASNCGYWNNTAVFVTWDDWGGWYDHVTPSSVIINQNQTWGSGYVYGFRVPLLVASAYTPQGYVSDPWNGQGNPPTSCDVNTQHCMDFGSILKFVEANWTLGWIGGGNGQYADVHATAIDSGFFGLTQARPFQYVSAPKSQMFFIGYSDPPQPPDNDGD